MGGVVDFVEDVVGGVVDAAGDALEWVGDTASNIVENALDDPLKTAAQIAVIAATGGTGAAALGLSAPISAMAASASLAAIEGIDVLEEGGSVEDALKGAATTFAVSQGVNFAVNSFGTPGVTPSGGETTQFWDDGSSIQWFDDGSSIVTDAAGQISATPATDIVAPSVGGAAGAAEVVPSEALAAEAAEAAAAPAIDEAIAAAQGPAEVVPIGAPATPDIAEIVGTPASPEMVPPSYGDMAGTIQRYDDGSSLQFFDDGSTLATDALGETSFSPAMDYVQPGFVDPNAPGFGEQAGAEIIDRSIRSEDLPTVVDRPLTDTITDIAKEAGSAVYDFAKENPLTTIGATAAIAGAMGEEEPPAAPGEQRRTYTYGAPIQVGSTKGLEELYSAASGIYGDKLGSLIGLPPSQAPTGTAPSASPLLGGPAGGGLASLPRSYTPVSGGQTFDISTLTPEQIIRLQELMGRRRQ